MANNTESNLPILLGGMLLLNASRFFISLTTIARDFNMYDDVKPLCFSAFHLCKLIAYVGGIAFISSAYATRSSRL